MEIIPFVYGRLPENVDFTNRKQELLRLQNNFSGLINTIIISPRRWGKTSLVKKAGTIISEHYKDIRVIHLDIFNTRTEKDFYLSLANEILKSTSSGWEDLVKNAKLFLSRLIPRISFSPDKQTELSFGISWEELEKHPDEILDLAERIAENKKLKLIICIDEFQSIDQFEHSEAFQKKLRSHWQQHSRVAYCLYGSKRHMLMNIFTNSSMPFYKFGDVFFLEKIAEEEWVSFIVKRFNDTGKTISTNDALLIARKAENHSYYVQQLAQQAWFRTDKACDTNIIEAAHKGIVDQLSLLFVNMTEALSSKQLELLRAIINNEKQITSKEVLMKYNLGTSANVIQLRRVLINNDVIDDLSGDLTFSDPMYKYWLERYFFKVH